MSLFVSQKLGSGFSRSLILGFFQSEIDLNKPKLDLILEFYPDIWAALNDRFFELRNSAKTTGKWAEKLVQIASVDQVEFDAKLSQFKLALQKANIQIVDYTQVLYPPEILKLLDFPAVLYYQGDISIIPKNRVLGVVGSRNIQDYTKSIMNQILPKLTCFDVSIVSGLAYGVDSLSQEIAIHKNIPCISVIGSGLDDDSFYPKTNLSLKAKILEQGGVVISQYAPGIEPSRYTFPKRNRLIAALSDLLWVPQAGLGSGSLITVTEARNLDKKVATTPANILDSNYGGNTEIMLKQGVLITKAQDILMHMELDDLGISSMNLELNLDSKSLDIKDEIQKQIYSKLNFVPQEIDTLTHVLKIPSNQLASQLGMMELLGYCRHTGENRWVRG